MELTQKNAIPVLSMSNYHSWSRSITNLFQQKGFSRVLSYEDFETWYFENGIIDSQQEKYNKRVETIELGKGTDDEKDLAKERLDTIFHSD